jgi:N-methylhydantoinase B
VREYAIESDGVALHASYGRTATRPWGVDGGSAGSVNAIEVVRGDTRQRLTRPPGFALRRGDRVLILTGGGGGWGEPRQREPEAVARDVHDNLLTVADAAAIYGVAIDPKTGTVDRAATAKLRGPAAEQTTR